MHKVRDIILGHLKEAKDYITETAGNEHDSSNSIGFVKFLIEKYPNTDTEVNAASLWNEYCQLELA